MKKDIGHRSVFISDLHLGSKHCQDEELLKFLKEVRTEKLYLVGDIVDGWRLQKKWYWPNNHNRVIKELISISKYTDVYWISGNHDEFLRTIPNINVGKIETHNRLTHIGVDGKKYLVVHGDMFDYLMRTRFGKTVMRLGDWGYDKSISINYIVNKIRNFFGYKPWSLAKYLKRKAKLASNFIGEFETEMVKYARKKNYDGIICGHIHHAEIKQYDEITYMNDGDWCESCSVLIEDHEGNWKINYYEKMVENLGTKPRRKSW